MASLPNSSKGALARAPLQIPKNASHAWYVVRPIRKALHPRDRRSRRPSFLSVGGHKPRPTSRQTKPTVAPGRAGEVIAPDAVHLVREVVHPVGVEHLPVLPEHLSGLGIDLESYFFADCKPLLPFPLLCLRFTSGCAFHFDHPREKPAEPRTRRMHTVLVFMLPARVQNCLIHDIHFGFILSDLLTQQQ